MKIVILLFIGVVGFTSILFAQERNIIVDSSLMVTPQNQRAEPTGFQWQNSLSGIRKSAADLMEANQKAAQEYNSLSAEAGSLQAEVTQSNEQNKTLQDAIVARQMELLAPVKTNAAGPIHDELVLTQKVTAKEKQDLSVLRVKLKNLESRTTLLQLKIKGLELGKQALLVDQKTGQEPSSFDGKPELNRLKASLESLRGQEEDLQAKIADARNQIPLPTPEDEKLLRERSALKADLAILQQERADLNKRIKERGALMNSLSFKRYLELVARKEALTKKAEDLKKQKVSSDDKLAKAPVMPATRDWKADIKGLSDENAKIDEQIGDLRENITVLEYKINTLARYKDRNKSGL